MTGISHYFDSRTKEQIGNSKDIIIREAFLRTSRDALDNYGVESFAVELIRGALDMLEKIVDVQGELDKQIK